MERLTAAIDWAECFGIITERQDDLFDFSLAGYCRWTGEGAQYCFRVGLSIKVPLGFFGKYLFR
jgi:hypothetical protein